MRHREKTLETTCYLCRSVATQSVVVPHRNPEGPNNTRPFCAEHHKEVESILQVERALHTDRCARRKALSGSGCECGALVDIGEPLSKASFLTHLRFDLQFRHEVLQTLGVLK